MSGNITKRSNGSYLARYRDANRKEHSKTFHKKSEAQAWLNEITSSMVTGRWIDPRHGRVTMAAYYEQFRDRQHWQTTTTTAMNLAVSQCTFAQLPLSKITRAHVELWVAEMTDRGLAPGTVQTRLSNVRTVLNGAQRDHLIAVDPSRGVKAPRARRQSARLTVPTREEVAAIVAATDPAYRALTAAAAYAGLRLGEAAALQRGDLLDGPVLRVERQVQRAGGGKVEIRRPKYDSERKIAIHPRLGDLLVEHAQRNNVVQADAFLFTTSSGIPPHQNTVSYAHRQARQRAGLPWINFHMLRHYYASGLIRQGMTVVEVQHALGHESPRETIKTYAHLWNDAGDRIREASAGLFPDGS